MAAKVKAGVKGKAPVQGRQKTKVKARPRGLQMTAAQRAAYTRAFNATATRLRRAAALRAAAMGSRRYRLNAAYALRKRYNIARGSVQAASVAAYAVSMSWRQSRLAHQNSALQLRIERDMAVHNTKLNQAQYVRAGIRALTHSAVMRTMTVAQAMNFQKRFQAKQRRNARKAARSVKKFKPAPSTAASRAILAAARKAGLAAAGRVKGNPKASPGTGRRRGRPKGSTVASGAKARTVKGATAAGKGNARQKASSGKKKPVTAKGRTAPFFMGGAWLKAVVPPDKPEKKWAGDEVTPDCVITAIANSLIHATGIVTTTAERAELASCCPAEPTIEEALWQTWLTGWPGNGKVRLAAYKSVPYASQRGVIIGYETENGPHAALSLGDGQVVSWGSETTLTAPVEEAWQPAWGKL
jgi:hypothetical protein